ncbi:hypothetical protein SKAU_G00213600 [Synaphobranchus kaupii]|uniref:Uncharacterized protein n=1 Tax=Synaphobranchus kaupii TaxID=118154 RepID=A0A9Q1IVA3_SYNKA|nr:hypothetical protein SKAU_G00213600 [Synaphobranchus kaupii]
MQLLRAHSRSAVGTRADVPKGPRIKILSSNGRAERHRRFHTLGRRRGFGSGKQGPEISQPAPRQRPPIRPAGSRRGSLCTQRHISGLIPAAKWAPLSTFLGPRFKKAGI